MTYPEIKYNIDELANGIIERAAEDWRAKYKYLKHCDDFRQVRFNELRQFFRSSWCALLCGEQTAKTILNMLEQERQDIIEQAKAERAVNV